MSTSTIQSRGLWHVVEAACRTYHASAAEVMAGRRYSSATRAKAKICYDLYEKLGCYSEVARLMDMDHSSVMHAIRRFVERETIAGLSKSEKKDNG